MPAAYAHYTFGKKVFLALPAKIRQRISASPANKRLFALGLQGPDPFFFYRPVCPNRILRLAGKIHREPAVDFFEQALAAQDSLPSDELASYLLGFACHFTLDSSCHPYIAYRIEETAALGGIPLGHHQIESEFDRMLMERDGRDPMTFNPACYLFPKENDAAVMAGAFPGVSAAEAAEALTCMALAEDILTGRTALKRALIGGPLSLTPLRGLMLPKKTLPRYAVSNEELEKRWLKALPKGVLLLTALWARMFEDEPLPERFYRNFE